MEDIETIKFRLNSHDEIIIFETLLQVETLQLNNSAVSQLLPLLNHHRKTNKSYAVSLFCKDLMQTLAIKKRGGFKEGSDRSRENVVLEMEKRVALRNREVDPKLRESFKEYIRRSFESDPKDVSGRIEECIYAKFKNNDRKYKSTILQKVFNLRNAKQLSLNKAVLDGTIAPQTFVDMTFWDMAHDSLKKERETYQIVKVPQLSPSEDGLFTCGKCKLKKCTYTQAQTRSADEPMTTFVLCCNCGHRWKC